MQSPVGPFRSYRKSSIKPPSLVSTLFFGGKKVSKLSPHLIVFLTNY